MSARRVITLFVVAILVGGLAVYLSTQRHAQSATATGTLVFPQLKGDVNKVSEVRLSKADGTRTTLKKDTAGWAVTERNFAADAGKVRKLLLELAALKVEEEKTADPLRYAAIGVEDPKDPKATGTRIDIVGSGKTHSLVVGKSAGMKSSYLRLIDAKQSLLVSPRLSNTETDPQQWLDRTALDIPQARIQSVSVEPISGPAYLISRAKKEDENFTVANLPKGRKLSSDSAPNVLAESLESVSLDDVRSAADPETLSAAIAAYQKSMSDAHAKEVLEAQKDKDKLKDLREKEAQRKAERSQVQATFRTFDGLVIKVSGHKEGEHDKEKHFLRVAAESMNKDTAGEAQRINARLQGHELEINSWKYEGLFKPLEDLLERAE